MDRQIDRYIEKDRSIDTQADRQRKTKMVAEECECVFFGSIVICADVAEPQSY